ncbi:MAG: NAD-dependent epimerase/dehydratase family protein [Chlamydiota bacterium]
MALMIGCGYVGEKIATQLLDDSSLTITTRSTKRLKLLQTHFPKVCLLNASDLATFKTLLDSHRFVILTMAPDTPQDYESCYLQTVLHLKHAIEGNTSIKQIIYTSASSVYGECHGNTIAEEAPLQAATPQGKILIETEKVLESLKSEDRKICIFRVSEIYGPDRSIKARVENLLTRKAPGDGSQLTNMIHVEDLVSAILFAKDHQLDGVYNLSDDEHMSRKAMYDEISKLYNLGYVKWDPSLQSPHRGNKCLSNEKLKKTGFSLKFSRRIF